MRKFIFAIFIALCLVATMANATLISTKGARTAAGVYALEFDTSGEIAVRSHADLVIEGTFTNSGKFVVSTELAVTSDALTAAESGITIHNAYTLNGATYTLPTAAAGLVYSFISTNIKTFSVDTGLTTDTIRYLQLDAGDKITSTAVTGDSVTVQSAEAGYWDIKAMTQTWTDGG